MGNAIANLKMRGCMNLLQALDLIYFGSVDCFGRVVHWPGKDIEAIRLVL